MSIGDKIKERRIELKWSQRELAARMGYTDHTTITRIESGKTDPPQSRVAQFAKVLGVTPGHLMGWDANPTEAGALAANVLRDPDAFQFVKEYMALDEVDRYALGLVLESMKLKKAQKKTDAKASAVESVVEIE